MLTVLLICTGNTCRSPMAAALLEHILAQKMGAEAAGIKIESAGLGANPGSRAALPAVEVMQEEGLDLTGHRARRVTREMLQAADLILTMTPSQKELVLALEPAAEKKTYSLGQLATLSGLEGSSEAALTVDDPFGQSLYVYRQVREQMRYLLRPIVEYISQKASSSGD
ncbi:MAG: low molecular weight protein arginine phosphatase [Firmicutes bacterium]|nr:low molecular weight protein arginine phosphatase [Bacillota bacterium]